MCDELQLHHIAAVHSSLSVLGVTMAKATNLGKNFTQSRDFGSQLSSSDEAGQAYCQLVVQFLRAQIALPEGWAVRRRPSFVNVSGDFTSVASTSIAGTHVARVQLFLADHVAELFTSKV